MTQASPSCVLVVEDDAIIAMIVEEILLDMGLQVLTSSTLDSALADIEMGAFDAAVIDMHLRGDSAYPVAEALLQGGLPFIVLSGSDQSDFRAAHPRIKVLAKPFDKADLEQHVREMLGV